MTIDRAMPRVHEALKAIADGRGGVDTLIISVRGRESVYVQFSSDPGRRIGGEAVSNAYLDPAEALSSAAERRLMENGSQDTLELALTTVWVLSSIYGVVDPDDLVLDVFA